MTEQQSQPSPTTPGWTIRSRQRDPKVFAGLRDEDVEDWLDSYDRVSVYNRWDNPTKLANVVFYLTDVAKTWFLNHEEEIPDWDAFTTKLKDIFGTPTSRKENAKKKLETRRQGEETYTSYIEDVLALCRRVNCEMQESERVRNLLKGIAEPAFNVFLVRKPESIADITSVCQHLDEMRTIRVSCPAQNLGEPKATNSELRTLIRDIVREELREMFNETHRGAEPAASSPDLRSLVRDELAALPPATLPLPTPAPPTYAEIAARMPSPQVASLQQLHTPPSLAAFTPATLTPTYQSWRPPNRPVCYYCGIRGHIARYCRKRRDDDRYDNSYHPHFRRDQGTYNVGRNNSGRQGSISPQRSRFESQTYPRRRSPSPLPRSGSPMIPSTQTYPKYPAEN